MSKKSVGGFFVRPGNNLNLYSQLASKSKLLVAMAVGLTIACAPLSAAEVKTKTKLVKNNNAECSTVGTIWWNELLAPEPKTLGKFYSKVIGWKNKFVDINEQTAPPSSEKDKYTIFMSGDQEIAGMMSESHIEALSSKSKGWLIYFQVANVRDAVKTAEKAGGTVLQRPFEIADGHQIAIIRDPDNNVFGVVTPTGIVNCNSTASK